MINSIVDKYPNWKFLEGVKEVIWRKDSRCSWEKRIKVAIQKKKSKINKWDDEEAEEISETCKPSGEKGQRQKGMILLNLSFQIDGRIYTIE